MEIAPSNVSNETTGIGELSKGTLKTLWERMTAIYGHRWVSSYSDTCADVAGATWAAGLAGFTAEQLGRGLRECARGADAWPPSLPEFRALCLGVPSLFEVERDLRPGYPNPSPFARMVQSWLDPFALRNADARESRRMIRDAFEECARYVLHNGGIPESRLRIADDETSERERYDRQHWERFSQFEK